MPFSTPRLLATRTLVWPAKPLAPPTGLWMFGEITTSSNIDFEAVARETIRSIGYDDPAYEFDYESCEIGVYLHSQSPDIDAAVSTALEDRGDAESDNAQQGAGDQGMMIGYAVDETPRTYATPDFVGSPSDQKYERCPT